MSLPHSGSGDVDVDGFILAGGQSSRMGQDKALIQLAGTPLIQRALAILRAASLNPRIAGTKSDLGSWAPAVPDDLNESGLGPLSGVCSALSFTSARYSVFLPVDLPFMPSSLITHLLHQAAIAQPAVTTVSIAGFIQTFPAVVHRATLPALQSSLRSNDRNCLRAFREAADALSKPFSVLPVELLLQAGQVSHPQGFPGPLWFLNVNSRQDLSRAESLLARYLQVS